MMEMKSYKLKIMGGSISSIRQDQYLDKFKGDVEFFYENDMDWLVCESVGQEVYYYSFDRFDELKILIKVIDLDMDSLVICVLNLLFCDLMNMVMFC